MLDVITKIIEMMRTRSQWVDFALAGVAMLAFFVLSWQWQRLLNRRPELKGTVAQQGTPQDISLLALSDIGRVGNRSYAAEIIDLVVRRYVRIFFCGSRFIGGSKYGIEIIKDVSDLKWEERQLLQDTFGDSTELSIGQRMKLEDVRYSTTFFNSVLISSGRLSQLVLGEYGLREDSLQMRKWARRTGLVCLLFGLAVWSPMMLFPAITTFISGRSPWRLTDKGLNFVRQLEGLRQSTITDETLYERLLPYAVLLNQEHTYVEQIVSYYSQRNAWPDWYDGETRAFDAQELSRAVHDVIKHMDMLYRIAFRSNNY